MGGRIFEGPVWQLTQFTTLPILAWELRYSAKKRRQQKKGVLIF